MVDDIFRVVLDPDMLVAGVAAVVFFGAVMTFAGPLLRSDRFESRLKSVASHREKLRRASREAMGVDKKGGLRRSRTGALGRLVEKLNLRNQLEDPQLANKLMQAGMRGERPVAVYYMARAILPFVFGAAVAVYLFMFNDHEQNATTRLGLALGGGVFGLYAPGLYISNKAAQRRQSIMGVFPDALDLLLICVEAGMSIEAAFAKVAAEVGTSSIELAEELSLTTAELSYLQERRQAYENLAKRTNHPGIKAVSTALIQSERYGTPLGTALRVMAKENRDMRLSAAEKKAAALPAKLTVPMIVFFLPVLFIVILGPALIQFNQMGGQP